MMQELTHRDRKAIRDIWSYDVACYKGSNFVELDHAIGTRYLMAINCRIMSHGFVSTASGYTCVQTNRSLQVEMQADSVLCVIEFFGASPNAEQMFHLDELPTGNLSYMDGGTNTNAINPDRKGMPVINYAHFPKGMSQTLHTHPSQRVGLILSGKGRIELDDNKFFPLKFGSVWVMERNTLHNFLCDQGEDVTLFVFAPDSGTGPTDEVNPLKVRTYVGQQRS
jgi:quercetin dioxygenase-like cupin family protein